MTNELIKRLRNTPNWQRESYGDWKQGTVHYDRAPFEAADALEAQAAEIERLKVNIAACSNEYAQLETKLDAAQAQEPELLKCDIAPRPLSHPLSDYHIAMSEGPLHFTWQDKPHRLVYDLIAAVRYYASPVVQQQPLTDGRQPLSKVLSAIREYLPPDGISAKDCLHKIIAIVDPWPLPSKPLIAMKDVEISRIAHNEDDGDWNSLHYRDSWHEGFNAGFRAAEAEHGIGGQQP